MTNPAGGLGFTFEARKNGTVEIFHHDRRATVLRGKDAMAFLAKAEKLNDDEIQQLLARITGNYKRGNERSARNHHRNRRG